MAIINLIITVLSISIYIDVWVALNQEDKIDAVG